MCERMWVGHLEHQPTHAEDHAEQVHVVRRGILQGGIGLGAWWLVPATSQMHEAKLQDVIL